MCFPKGPPPCSNKQMSSQPSSHILHNIQEDLFRISPSPRRTDASRAHCPKSKTHKMQTFTSPLPQRSDSKAKTNSVAPQPGSKIQDKKTSTQKLFCFHVTTSVPRAEVHRSRESLQAVHAQKIRRLSQQRGIAHGCDES